MIDKWDHRYLGLAAHVAQWSKDPSTKVGAVIARPDKTIASLGFNGFPRGVDDTDERLNHRPTKYAMVVHAEGNAIVNAREPLHDYTLYVDPMFPCSNCAALIIQSGIKRVVTVEATAEQMERWGDSFKMSTSMFSEAGVIAEFAERFPEEDSPEVVLAWCPNCEQTTDHIDAICQLCGATHASEDDH